MTHSGSKPFELSWMCCLEPSNLAEELHSLKIGVDTINWYRKEIDKYGEIVKGIEKENRGSPGKDADKASQRQADEELLGEFASTFVLNR